MKEKTQDDGHEQESLYVSSASANEMEDTGEIESIDARRDSIAELSVPDMAHFGDIDARCLVQGEEHRHEVDETDKLTDEPVQVSPNMGAGGSHSQATSNQEEEERNQEWTRELCEIRRVVGFVVRWERKLDVKADVAVRRLERLERLEKENDE